MLLVHRALHCRVLGGGGQWGQMSFSLFLKTWILVRKAFASPPVFGRRALPAGRKKGLPCAVCPREHQSSQGAVACSKSQCPQFSFGAPSSPWAHHSTPQQNWCSGTFHGQVFQISGVQSRIYSLKKELHFLFFYCGSSDTETCL